MTTPKFTTTAELAEWLAKEKLPEIEADMELAEADGTSDYDYYEGLQTAYSIVLASITGASDWRELVPHDHFWTVDMLTDGNPVVCQICQTEKVGE